MHDQPCFNTSGIPIRGFSKAVKEKHQSFMALEKDGTGTVPVPVCFTGAGDRQSQRLVRQQFNISMPE
ncbi:hypothetical protein CEF21_20475 [Bacillus sp. FJAT-42376]|nr:hypothetical protein CEF21_20475 [Bacillus sp. FJAT-42376]